MSYHYIPTTLESLAVPLAELHPFPGNARRGNVADLVISLEKHGQYRAIVANRRNLKEHGGSGAILAGNHTYRAMGELQGKGATHIAVTWVDVDAEAAIRINLIDNKTGDDADYELELLLAQLQSLPDLDGTGYDGGELDELIATLEESEAKPVGDGENQKTGRGAIGKSAAVKIVLEAPDLALVERALDYAGTPNRGHALATICRAYLGIDDAEG